MRSLFGPLLFVPALVVAVSGLSPVARAAAQRTFVASYGAPTNVSFNCSITKPCRAFSEAIGVTNPNGEVIVLDSAGYGPVTITKSVSIIAPPGIYAGITAFSDVGVRINAPLGTVVLRGLSINGQGGDSGIYVFAATAVSIESCVVSGIKFYGVQIDGGADVRIVGSILRFNGQSGIAVTITATATKLAVEDAQSERNGLAGLELGLSGIVRGSRFIANGLDGILIQKNSGEMTLSVSDSELSGNGRHGLFAVTTDGFVGMTADRVSASSNGMDGVRLSSQGGGALNSAFGGSQIAWNSNVGIETAGSGVNNVVVSSSAVNMNGSIGIAATGGAVIQITANSIARNGDFDLQQSRTGVIRTFGNNALTAGGSDVSGTLTGASLK